MGLRGSRGVQGGGGEKGKRKRRGEELAFTEFSPPTLSPAFEAWLRKVIEESLSAALSALLSDLLKTRSGAGLGDL